MENMVYGKVIFGAIRKLRFFSFAIVSKMKK